MYNKILGNNITKQEALNEANSILTWVVIPERVTSDYILVGFFLCIPAFAAVYMFLNDAPTVLLLFITVGLILVCIFPHFTMLKPQIYRFELTKLGVRIGITDNAHEIFYSATRKAAWVGCVACVIAFFAIGPLAFAGGAAFALMAPKFTQFRRRTIRKDFFLHRTVSLRYHREAWRLSIRPHYPTETRYSVYYNHASPVEFYIEPRKLYLLVTALKSVTSVREVVDVSQNCELFPIYDLVEGHEQL
ncbi:hypothetical protein [Vibrio sp. 10N]|uniref:hypothetical protein n=1 Tax=Vibrio sp. 10N TaxID=3058938 RepID=UPI0030C72572